MNGEITDHNPFGVLEFLHWNHSWNSYRYASKKDVEKIVEFMQEAGAGFVRIDFLWQDIEPQKGNFTFEKYDYLVDVLARHRIQILGIFDYSVDWASAGGQWNYPPLDNTWFVNYVLKVINRYKGRIKYWEVWNEPDSPVYWAKQDDLKGYCSLLKEVYLAAKKEDPGCKILNGGLADSMISVHRLYENGAKDYFDIFNLHVFVSPLYGALIDVQAYPKVAYKVMEGNGDGNKKIWVTEIGCPGVPRGKEVKDWWLGKNPDEDEQARWLKEVFSGLLQDKNVERVFWAFFRDCKSHWNDGIDYFGIVRWDFSKKPAFASLRQCYENFREGR